MTNLRLVESSTDSESGSANPRSGAGRERLKQLRKMEQSVAMRRRGVIPAAAANTLLVGLITLGVVGEGLARSGLHPSFCITAVVSTVLATAAGFFTFRGHKLRTWNEVVYEQLAAYAPANSAAYRTLQASIREHGLDGILVQDFVDAELETLLADMPKGTSRVGAARSRFLRRRV